MTPEDKLNHVLSELKRVRFPDEHIDAVGYWNMVEVECDNAADAICDNDLFVKNLIEYIEKKQ
jgi:hypothetical protein